MKKQSCVEDLTEEDSRSMFCSLLFIFVLFWVHYWFFVCDSALIQNYCTKSHIRSAAAIILERRFGCSRNSVPKERRRWVLAGEGQYDELHIVVSISRSQRRMSL